MFCKVCGLPVKFYGTGYKHTLANGLAIRVGHEPEPVEFAAIARHNDADVDE